MGLLFLFVYIIYLLFLHSSVAGHSFGEIALLDTDVRNASVIAEEDVDLLVISRQLFESTIKVAMTLSSLND